MRYFCFWFLSFWPLSSHCFRLVDLVCVYVCCWGMTFQLCVQSNWQRGSEKHWGVMRGAGVFWGLPTNGYHGEPLLSKPPRSQLLTCSVMGLLNSVLYMDMKISFFLSFITYFFIFLFCFSHLFVFLFFFHTFHVALCFTFFLSFPFFLPLIIFVYLSLFGFFFLLCITMFPLFGHFLFLSYLRLTNCTIMRPVVLLNPLCMACAGSGSEHSLFWVIIIQFANTQPLC